MVGAHGLAFNNAYNHEMLNEVFGGTRFSRETVGQRAIEPSENGDQSLVNGSEGVQYGFNDGFSADNKATMALDQKGGIGETNHHNLAEEEGVTTLEDGKINEDLGD